MIKISNIFFCLFIIILFSRLCHGNIFSWTDEDGIRHFSNIAPPVKNQSVEIFKENHTAVTGHQFKVLKIYDGDTIKVSGLDLIFKIRLAGIDSPETEYGKREAQPFSRKATRYLATLLANQTITIQSYGTGGYNRQLAEIFVKNKNINLAMVKAGFAEVYKGKLPEKLDSVKYLKEELKAKKAKKGMWVQGRTYISPKQWRKDHPVE